MSTPNHNEYHHLNPPKRGISTQAKLGGLLLGGSKLDSLVQPTSGLDPRDALAGRQDDEPYEAAARRNPLKHMAKRKRGDLQLPMCARRRAASPHRARAEG